MQDASSYFTFDKRPVIEDGRCVGNSQEPLKVNDIGKYLDQIIKEAVSESKELIELGMEPDMAIEASVVTAIAGVEQGRYLGQVDAKMTAQIESEVKGKVLKGSKGEIRKASVQSLTSRLDKIASILEANGLEDLAKIVDASSNSLEALEATDE